MVPVVQWNSLSLYSSLKESISENVHVIGSLERLWRNSALLTDEKRNTLPQHYGKIWMFRRCLIRGTVFHSKSYKRVVARNDYTVEFQYMQSHYYGSIHMYVKVEEKCLKAICSEQKCCCDLTCHYFAIIEILETACQQLPEYIGRSLVKHITRVKASKRYYWFCTYIIWMVRDIAICTLCTMVTMLVETIQIAKALQWNLQNSCKLISLFILVLDWLLFLWWIYPENILKWMFHQEYMFAFCQIPMKKTDLNVFASTIRLTCSVFWWVWIF